MLNIIKNMLVKNWKWKVYSLIFAMVFWFYCMNVESETNIRTTSITVPLTIVGLDTLGDDKVLQNETELNNTNITISVKGTPLDIQRITKSDLTAYIDFSVMEISQTKLFGEPLETWVQTRSTSKFKSIAITGKYPEKVSIVIDRYIRVNRNVMVSTLDTKPPEGYRMVLAESTPESVEISGARTSLAKIEEIRVGVDIKGETSDVELSDVELHAYDVDGNIVEGIIIDPPVADIKVTINKLGKVSILRPGYIGEPPEGYALTDVDWEPKYAEIMGSAEAVDNASSITLNPTDVSSFTSTDSISFDLWSYVMPEGLQIINGKPQEVVVTYTIEKLQKRNLELSVEDLTVKGYSVKTEFAAETIPFTVQGTQYAISNANLDGITGTVNLIGLQPGEHSIPVTLSLPNGIELSGEPPSVTLTILEQDADAEEGEEGDIGSLNQESEPNEN